jgi:hypothetical protein
MIRGGVVWAWAGVLLMLASVTPARAEGDFPIAGVYTKDHACTAAAAERKDLRVKITRKSIESSMGTCRILHRKRNGKGVAMHVECMLPAGQVILGDVTFTIRNKNTLDFDDQDHTSPAVLYRCTGR